MQSSMALMCLVLVASAPHALGETGDPVAKVIEMISGLQAKVIAEAEDATKMYDEYAEWCEDKSKELGFEIKTAQGDVGQLQAEIDDLAAIIDECSTKIEELTGEIAVDEADLKAATEIRAKEEAAFLAEEGELVEVVDTLHRAIAILEKEMKKGASMLQLQNAGTVAQALKVMVQASAFSSADASRLTALLQSSQQEADDSSEDAPAAAAYEGHGGGIIEAMEGLLAKAEAQLAECRKTEGENLHNFEVLKQSLADELNFGNGDLAKAKKCVKESGAEKATLEGELSVASKDLAEDQKAKAALHSECMTKATEYEEETKDRDEELKALASAKEAIQKGTGGEGGAADQAYGLQQVSLLQISRSRENLANNQAVRFVRDLARKENLPELAQLASRMASALRMGTAAGDDPFAKVKGLIEEMIVRLEKEAAEEAAHKAYCDKEFKETYAKEDEKKAEIDKLTTAINKAKARSELLKGEVATLSKELADLAASQKKADTIREEEKALFDKNSAEMKQGLEGVKLALKILREFYGKGEGAQGAGGTIIGLIEVIESDFEKLLSTMTADEEAAAEAYEKMSKENELTVATKEQDVKYKTKEFTGLDKTITELSSDLSGVEEELSAVLEYLEKIKEACIAKPETYEERKKRREQEIAGLKAALEILEGEAVLLQTSTAVRSLRGPRA